MNLFAEGGPWLTILFFSVLFLVIFRRPLGWLLKLLARSALGLGFLALWSQSGLAAGLALGVNAFNALPLAADAGASSGDPDRNEVLRALNDTPGLYTVAQVSCLRDSALVREEPGLSLHRVSGSPWLDESRQGWLDPAQPQVQSYLIGLCRELAQLGFDEILLTDCGFPTQGDLDSLRAVEEKEETLETFCRQLQGALADTPVTLSVMGQRDSVTADPVSGQTTALLATFGRVWTQAEDQEALAAFDPVVLPAVS